MAVTNGTILERAWLAGSNDFQQRIPNPTIAGYDAAVNALFQPFNHDMFNQFTGLLVGLMDTIIEGKRFENPLRSLKKPATTFGNTERHIAMKYLQAHSYKVDDETLLKLERPEFREWFYSVSEPRRYEFSWSKFELQRIFTAGEGSYKMDDALANAINTVYSSAEYDEMNIMVNAFAIADKRMGGIFRHNISAAPTTEATAKELLTAIRAYAGRLKFPSTLYNHLDVPVFSKPDELILWVTPEVNAVLDVEALAYMFNIDRGEVPFRIIEIAEFPIPNVYAAITSDDFIYCRDVLNGMEPPFYTPNNMVYKFYYHVAQMLGANPLAPAILFTTETGTVIPTITMTASGLTASFVENEVAPGGTAKIVVNLTGNISPVGTSVTVQPDAARFKVAASRTVETKPVAVPLNSRTYVDAKGILHVQKSGLEDGDVITVTAYSSYINPSGATTEYSASDTITISSSAALGAKECPVEIDPYITYAATAKDSTASE